MSGILYIVSTPIGNLKDITLRCLEVLKSSEYILVESSAHSSKLLNEYNIDSKLVTFNKDNEKRKIKSITDDLSNGAKICLISDAGTPSISDPGFELIRFIKPPIKIIPIPGPSSLTAALSISKIPINKFIFLGFLSKKQKDRENQILNIKNSSMPAVVFESKHRIVSLLKIIIEILGPSTKVAVMKELTKLHEQTFYDDASNLLENFESNPINGEITIIIGTINSKRQELDIFDDKIIELSKKHSASEIVNIIRLFSDVNKKELYKYVLKIRQGG